ncbi:hypothetical protein WSM22_05170 [Cytophagales bacterium WSM2-2]|nr:hypothetical protein WSM22_05170 [Cytophagales bacterium WSM2-2]
MRIFLLLLFPTALFAQFENSFKYGAITYQDLQMREYPKDTSAVALVLDEFGETYMQSASPYNLVLEYHVKIKILKREGFELANYEIPLRISGNDKESISQIQASTFNLENNSIKETKIDPKNIFTENRNKFWDFKKFTMPDIRIGSVIEIRYILESSFIFKWRTWEFQSDIPKVRSEFWAQIPGNYVYNIVLRGERPLSKSETDVVKDCFTPNGQHADCALFKYAMTGIPGFKKEEYMTAKDNFLSAVYFELAEFKKFDGTSTRYTEEWKDVDRRLQTDESFGVQLRQAKKLWSEPVQLLTKGITDPLTKAQLIFAEIKKYYQWNETYGSYTDLGAKKAYQTKKGNIADINLSLVAALQAAEIQADPALLSTRQNGLPVMLHPVMSGFNYLIARVTIGNEKYWLDATHPLHPFGFVPERCLNGKVRVMSKVSEWVDLRPKDKDKKVIEVNVKASGDGAVKCLLKIYHWGYNAFDQRKAFYSHSTVDEYKKQLAKRWPDFEITSYSNQALDSLEKPFIEKIEMNLSETSVANVLYFSPFFIERWQKNPFRSAERNYPVDFGAPLEEVTLMTLEYSGNYAVDEIPKNTAQSLPQSGGRYLFSVNSLDNKIQVTSNLLLSKSVYSSEEYFTLRELFSRIVQVQQSQIVLKKK